MALFKILRGSSVNLPKDYHDGWAYFTTDTHEFFIDYDTGFTKEDGTPLYERACITNARLTPRLSPEGVYYFETTSAPVTNILYLSCGTAENFTPEVIYSAGTAVELESYDEILKHI